MASKKKNLFSWVLWFTPALIAWLTTHFIIQSVTISGTSMAPSLNDKQKVIMSKLDKTYERGEIVVFKAEGNDPTMISGREVYVKRIIGVAGDTIEYRDGDIYVNDQKVLQSYLVDNSSEMINASEQKSHGTSLPAQVNWTLDSLSTSSDWNPESRNTHQVPSGHVFVLGDHRSHSKDSRFFGYVDTDTIIGVLKEMPWSTQQEKDVITYPKDNFFE